MNEKIKIVWDLDLEKSIKMIGKFHAISLLKMNGVPRNLLRDDDFEKLSDLLSIKFSLLTKGIIRILPDLCRDRSEKRAILRLCRHLGCVEEVDPGEIFRRKIGPVIARLYEEKRREGKSDVEMRREVEEELRKIEGKIWEEALRESEERMAPYLSILQGLCAVDEKHLPLAVLYSFWDVKPLSPSEYDLDGKIFIVKHEKIDEEIGKILSKYRRMKIPEIFPGIDWKEVEKIWTEFETVSFPVETVYDFPDGTEEKRKYWIGLLGGAALGRVKKSVVPLKKVMPVYKVVSTADKKKRYELSFKLALGTPMIGGVPFKVENVFPISFHFIKPRFIPLKVERGGRAYYADEVTLEKEKVKIGGFDFEIPKKVLVRYKNVKPSSARILLAKKKFESYIGGLNIVYKAKLKSGAVIEHRKYSLVLFWSGHGLVRVGKDKKVKEFTRLYGILIDNDAGERYYVVLGDKRLSEEKKGTKRYYLNLIPHGHGVLIFGNQAILVSKNSMKESLFRAVLRVAETARNYRLLGWSRELNHDLISLDDFKVWFKDVEYNGLHYRVFVVIPSKNGQVLHVLNYHHRSEGFDRIIVKMNMNDLLIIVHQHPDHGDRDVFRERKFWEEVERTLGMSGIVALVNWYLIR